MGGDQTRPWLALSWLQPVEGGLEEDLGCDGRGLPEGLPLLPEFTSLSGSETAGGGETLPRVHFERPRILPRVLFSLDPAAFYFKIKYVGGNWDLMKQAH